MKLRVASLAPALLLTLPTLATVACSNSHSSPTEPALLSDNSSLTALTGNAREAEPGDDRRGGREPEPGDDHRGRGRGGDDAVQGIAGNREAQPGDDRRGGREPEPGDDRRGRGRGGDDAVQGIAGNREAEPGDDRGGRNGGGRRGGGRDDRPAQGAQFNAAVTGIAGNTITLAGGIKVNVVAATTWNPRGDLRTLAALRTSFNRGQNPRIEGRGARQADRSINAQTIKAEF